MGRVGKYVFLLTAVLFVLCISKRIDASELAVKFIFPNFAGIAYQKEEKLPITSEIEDTISLFTSLSLYKSYLHKFKISVPLITNLNYICTIMYIMVK
mgnify:CR=1 FL=1